MTLPLTPRLLLVAKDSLPARPHCPSLARRPIFGVFTFRCHIIQTFITSRILTFMMSHS